MSKKTTQKKLKGIVSISSEDFACMNSQKNENQIKIILKKKI